MRRLIDRVLTAVARVALAGFFRSVEVEGRIHLPDRKAPVLVVANHFNGFVDPVVLVRVLGRLPRFLAKATLWKTVAARPFLSLAGLIPVHRQVDSADTSGNQSAFHAAHEALRKGDWVGIFPEGTTHDEARLAPVRTGAARIALGARADGVEGIRIVPVGLLFEDKIALRSRLLVRVGAPIDLDELAPDLLGDGPDGDDNHEAVDQLTARIENDLRRVSPDFDTVRDRDTCRVAADIATRPVGGPRRPPRLGERERLAQRLGRRPEHEREALRAEVADYQMELTALGLSDGQLVSRIDRERLLLRSIVTGAAVFLLLPLAYAGLLVGIIPALLVSLAGRRVEAPVSKGTVRMLTAVVTFPTAWFLTAALQVDGLAAIFGTAFLLALGGLVSVRLVEAVIGLVGDLWSWQRADERRRGIALLREERVQLVERIEKVAG